MSRSLAHTTIGAKANRLKASEDAKGVCALQGMRIHQLMDQLEGLGNQVGKDAELQSKLIELKRVLGGIDPLLDKVAKRIEASGDTSNPTTITPERRTTTESTAVSPAGHEVVLASDGLLAVVEDGDTTADERDLPAVGLLLSDIDEGEASERVDNEEV